MKEQISSMGQFINDWPHAVSQSKRVSGKKVFLWSCPLYSRWKHMISRCYSEKYQAGGQSYIGCSVCPEWHSFSAFRAWLEPKYWEGCELDKDILLPGNKVYEPDLCVLVSSKLNTFLCDRLRGRGLYPLGVSFEARRGMFVARCSDPFSGKNRHLGYFSSSHKAHEAWKIAKHQLACRYADMQTDPRIAEALRKRFAL